jgi:hypothetical protein
MYFQAVGFNERPEEFMFKLANGFYTQTQQSDMSSIYMDPNSILGKPEGKDIICEPTAW